MLYLIFSPFSCLFSPFRLHDVCGGAAVCRVGSFLRHTSVSDHVGPHGAEQGQLGRPTAGTNFCLWGGRTLHSWHWHRRWQHGCSRKRNQLQRNTSGKQRLLTLLVWPFTSTLSWPRPQGLQCVGHPTVPIWSEQLVYFVGFCLPSWLTTDFI